MKSFGRKLAEALAFAIAMLVIAYFDGSLLLSGGARPLWFQVTARLLIYTAIFFVISLLIDALFSRFGKR